MAKSVHDDVLDAALDKIATSVTQTVCSDNPVNFAGISGVALADVTLTAGDGNGDYVIANGDTNGRKITISQQADVDIDSTGDADHIAYDDGATLLYVVTCTLQGLTSGGTVTVPAHDIEIADPS